MRFLFVPGLAFAIGSLNACSSSSQGASPDAAATDDASSDGASDHPDTGSGDATSPIDSGADGTTNHDGDAGDGGGSDGGDAVSCAPIVQSDAGGSQCPSADGPAAGEVLIYPCGLPVGNLDGGATADGGWASDGGHVFACMTLCNDIPRCYVTPFVPKTGAEAITEGEVLVTCCP